RTITCLMGVAVLTPAPWSLSSSAAASPQHASVARTVPVLNRCRRKCAMQCDMHSSAVVARTGGLTAVNDTLVADLFQRANCNAITISPGDGRVIHLLPGCRRVICILRDLRKGISRL